MVQDSKKTELFETMPIPKAVASLAVPTVLSSLVMVLYNLADTYFVGMLNDAIQTSAVTLAAPVLLAFNAVNNLFGVGCSSMMSRAMGRKDYDTVSRTSAFGFYCSIVSGILFSFFCTVFNNPLLILLGAESSTINATEQYMFWTVTCGAIPAILNVVLANMVRSEGSSLHASIGTMSGCALNVLLDPLFILPQGFNMGAAGAGCATFISNCVACIYFFGLLWVKRGKTFVSLDPRKFSFREDIVAGVCSVGIPASIQNLLNVTGMTILNNFTAGYGADAVAAMGITNKINMVPMYITMGIGQGIMPLVGYNYASRNSVRMKKAVIFTAKISFVFIMTVSIGYYLGAEHIVSLFMKNDVIVSYGAALLRGFCLGLLFLCMDFLAVGIFQAVGMGKESFIFAIMRKVLLEIPAMYVLNYFFPLYGLAYSQLVAEFVLAVAAVFVLMRLFKKLDATQPPAH